MTCIFCKIIQGELPSYQVYSDEICIAFLDIHPINPGHILVVPKKHSERFYEVDHSEAAHLMGVAQKIYLALKKTSIRCEGANFFLSDGAVAGQEVGHAHLHIAPRFLGDGQQLGFHRTDVAAATRQALEQVLNQLKTLL